MGESMQIPISDTNSRLQVYRDLFKPGQAASKAAGESWFADFRARKAENTIKRHNYELESFRVFLESVGLTTGDLAREPGAWRGITWGLVAGFRTWLLIEGYAVSSVNNRLATVRVYARLAAMAGAITPGDLAMIQGVKLYSQKEARHIDSKRVANGLQTRLGAKKKNPVSITRQQADQLKRQPSTPLGRRDALLMCLLLDHGLRCGEVQMLERDHFDLSTGELQFFRPKVGKIQIHKLTDDTRAAAKAYLNRDAPESGSIWRKGITTGELYGQGINKRSITFRVNVLGERIGIDRLSAHDCRHYWATIAARSGTPLDRLQEAGGWASPNMPLRYIESSRISNEGVKLK